MYLTRLTAACSAIDTATSATATTARIVGCPNYRERPISRLPALFYLFAAGSGPYSRHHPDITRRPLDTHSVHNAVPLSLIEIQLSLATLRDSPGPRKHHRQHCSRHGCTREVIHTLAIHARLYQRQYPSFDVEQTTEGCLVLLAIAMQWHGTR